MDISAKKWAKVVEQEPYGATLLRLEHSLQDVSCKRKATFPLETSCYAHDQREMALLFCRNPSLQTSARCCMQQALQAAQELQLRTVWWPTTTSKDAKTSGSDAFHCLTLPQQLLFDKAFSSAIVDMPSLTDPLKNVMQQHIIFISENSLIPTTNLLFSGPSGHLAGQCESVSL
jgi:hypothetical protein